MTVSTKTTIKAFFETGDFPSQGNFSDFIDSCAFLAETTAQVFVGGITVSGAFNASTTATIVGAVSAASLNVTGDVKAATGRITASAATISAKLTGATASYSGLVSADAGVNTTIVSAASVNTTGAVAAGSNVTAAAFIPSGATVPTNGMNLPAASTVGFACNSVQCVEITGIGLMFSRSGSFATPSATVSGTLIADTAQTSPNISSCGSVTTNDQQWAFVNGNGTVGSISTNGSTTTFATSSDYRLKENVQDYSNGLEAINSLRPVSFNWKVDKRPDVGFIAHEVGEVVPNACSGEKDAVDKKGEIIPQGIDTSFLAAHIVSAIKELNDRLTKLEQ